MHRRALACLLAPFVLVAAPAAAVAQIPGGDPNEAFERRNVVRAQIRAEALQRVSRTLDEWSEAWLEDDAEELADLYVEGASVRGLSVTVGVGRDAIREHLPPFLEDSGDIRLRLSEFDASGRLAYGVASYEFQNVGSGGAGEMRTGTVMMVFQKAGGWRIRSQLFRPEVRGD